MRYIRYFDGTKVRRVKVAGVHESPQRAPRVGDGAGFVSGPSYAAMRPQAAGDALLGSLRGQEERFRGRFHAVSDERTLVMPVERGETTIVPTETVTIDRARKADLSFLRKRHGMEVVEEGSHGKVLMRVPGDSDDPVGQAAVAAMDLHTERGSASAPNFLRVTQHNQQPAVGPNAVQWALDNPGAGAAGSVGLVGADVHALAAWTITRGAATIRVAVLDEGVDTDHPFIKPAVVAEADYVDHHQRALPDGDDAHGTACAGIVVSRDGGVSGLGPGLSLVAARIAKSNSQGFWIFDDFSTADAIDWCWDQGKADVLSNSWGGGPPSPVITNAFGRARTQGRGGKGSVVVVAAGNAQSPVDFPGNLPDVLTVGASNQWDKRKTKTSQDGENWWGSNYGKPLDIMAPGVAISTTDIHGTAGYSNDAVTTTFNGTSSATPFVAATAGLVLSVRPDLSEGQVRAILCATADPLTSTKKWSEYTGFGRCNAYAALWAARRV